MANKFARTNGNFDGPIWALTSNGVAGSTTPPTIGDNAIANTFTVEITGDNICDNITCNNNFGGSVGGRFILNASNTYFPRLSANINAYNSTYSVLKVTGFNTALIVGDITAGRGGIALVSSVENANTGVLNVYGVIEGFGGNGLSNSYGLINTSSGEVNVYGEVLGSKSLGGSANNTASGVGNSSSGIINVYGNVIGGSSIGSSNTIPGILNTGNGKIFVYGNVIGGSSTGSSNTNPGISNTSNGEIFVYGNCIAGVPSTSTGNSIINTSTGTITVYSNVEGTTVGSIINTSTGSVNIIGNIIADSRGGNGISSSNINSNVKVSGNIINALNGVAAIYASSYRIDPVPDQSYICHARNGTGVGSDAYLYQFPINSLSATSLPPTSAVRAGVVYGTADISVNPGLTGTCIIPPVSAVVAGVAVDNTVGTAILDLPLLDYSKLFGTLVDSISSSGSIGLRIKKIATAESVGRIISSFPG